MSQKVVIKEAYDAIYKSSKLETVKVTNSIYLEEA
jgi:hypothetical protein